MNEWQIHLHLVGLNLASEKERWLREFSKYIYNYRLQEFENLLKSEASNFDHFKRLITPKVDNIYCDFWKHYLSSWHK